MTLAPLVTTNSTLDRSPPVRKGSSRIWCVVYQQFWMVEKLTLTVKSIFQRWPRYPLVKTFNPSVFKINQIWCRLFFVHCMIANVWLHRLFTLCVDLPNRLLRKLANKSLHHHLKIKLYETYEYILYAQNRFLDTSEVRIEYECRSKHWNNK